MIMSTVDLIVDLTVDLIVDRTVDLIVDLTVDLTVLVDVLFVDSVLVYCVEFAYILTS